MKKAPEMEVNPAWEAAAQASVEHLAQELTHHQWRTGRVALDLAPHQWRVGQTPPFSILKCSTERSITFVLMLTRSTGLKLWLDLAHPRIILTPVPDMSRLGRTVSLTPALLSDARTLEELRSMLTELLTAAAPTENILEGELALLTLTDALLSACAPHLQLMGELQEEELSSLHV